MKLVLFAVALGVVATPAGATEFVGPRIELHAGWDRAGIDGRTEDGIVYGGGLGYDFAIADTATLGVEADVDFATTDVAVGGGELEAKRDLAAGVRLGIKLGEQALLYAKAGYTNARVTASAFGFSLSDDLDGVRLGVGAEYAYSDTGFAKVEYRYSNYESGFERSQLLFAIGARF
jgi:outer membrane immunogenic protein